MSNDVAYFLQITFQCSTLEKMPIVTHSIFPTSNCIIHSFHAKGAATGIFVFVGARGNVSTYLFVFRPRSSSLCFHVSSLQHPVLSALFLSIYQLLTPFYAAVGLCFYFLTVLSFIFHGILCVGVVLMS